MAISSFFKKSCIVFLLPLLFGCGGGGDVDVYNTGPNISVESSYDFGGIVMNNSSDKTFVIKKAIGLIIPFHSASEPQSREH